MAGECLENVLDLDMECENFNNAEKIQSSQLFKSLTEEAGMGKTGSGTKKRAAQDNSKLTKPRKTFLSGGLTNALTHPPSWNIIQLDLVMLQG